MDKQTPAEAASYIDAIIKRDEAIKSEPLREYQPPVVKKKTTAFGLWVVFAALTGFNIFWAARNLETFTQADIEAEALMDLLVAIDALDTYREEHGELPESLEAIEVDADGLMYRARSGGYHLQVQIGNDLLSYSDGGDRTWLEARLTALFEG